MTDFQMVHGFEDVWRPPVAPRLRLTRPVLRPGSRGMEDARARLIRVANRTPEVMVKVTGKTRDPGHLRAHLDYISRNGELELETQDGDLIASRGGAFGGGRDASATAGEAYCPRRQEGGQRLLQCRSEEGAAPVGSRAGP